MPHSEQPLVIESDFPANRATSAGVSRILLIDDQPLTAKLIRRMLDESPDLELHYCQDPVKAMQSAMDVRPVVILLDLNMPHVDGMILLRMFRNNRLTESLPIIILSADEDPHIKAEGFACGATNYLVKLPDRVEMIARLRYHANSFVALRRRSEKLENCSDMQRSENKGYLLFDSDSQRIFDANLVLCGVLETDRDALLGKTPMDLVSDDDHPLLEKMLNWIPREDKRIYEFYLVNARGKKIYTQCCVSTTPNVMDRASVTALTFVNPVVWKEANPDQTSRFRLHADTIPNIIWLSDTKLNRFFFNRHWLEHTGHILESELDGGWKRSIHPDDVEKLEKTSADALKERERYSCEYRLRSRDGSYLWMYETGVPFFNREWEFLGSGVSI